ncbi:MAG: ribulose-phosphate 3-epimerase [Bacilli bacterium]|jgi:ribulose-phosphate 3-epimerase|nr:ribulose-phosphate 3-epimerase [Bacilli bacterium]MCH4210868.1 ribulose-phosphate 3-epimerase [Bacilli bacterium]MCH4228384.1 ribulose-phosphate 3-epimerase [Bacilli bacterium]MCH4277929.1 ribulose-phosphate 3-epimerase [Bacilli bacterium]MCI2054883.1 ribulose-phosphate 3-epimerase [Bacilli bacterium]
MKDLSKYNYPAVSPSILSAPKDDLLNKGVIFAEKNGAHFIHLDVMDGHFVPAVTFDDSFIASISHKHHMVNDVHIMVEDPLTKAASYCKAGADVLTFHFEACKDDDEVIKTISLIKSFGVNAGLSIKPDTKVERVERFLPLLDLFLVMSVEPGAGGQPFNMEALGKISFLKEYKEKERLSYLIEVDGGINGETAPLAIKSGADLLVSGSYLFKDPSLFKERMEGLVK